MKKIKQLMLPFGIIGLVLILSIEGCKKELSPDSAKLKNADLLMSKEAGPGKKKVLRQSPGLKIEVKGETIKRISPTLKNIDKITSILNEEQSKKNQGGVMTTKSANFTASLAGTYYNCYAELNDPGPYDWYLINWNTGVYTYIGSSTDYINFNVQKPSMYGNYRVWGEGPYGAGFTGYQYLGDPYVGVSKVGGILSFTDQAAYDALIARLKDAYDAHQTIIDQFNSMNDDDADNALAAIGFRQFLPYEEFEAYMGFYSLRAKIQGEVDYWFANSPVSLDDNPEFTYVPYPYAKQTLLNYQGTIEIGGVGEGPFTLATLAGLDKVPSNPGSTTCMTQTSKMAKNVYDGGKNVKLIVALENNGNRSTFIGKSVTYANWGGPRLRKARRQQPRVAGEYYDPLCAIVGSFDSGLANTQNYRRKEVEVSWGVGLPNYGTKSGEMYVESTLTDYSSTPFHLTYSH